MTPEEVPAELVVILRRAAFLMTEGWARDTLAAVLPAYARLGSEHDAECKRVWDEYPKLVTRLRNAEAGIARAERALGMARTIHSNNPAGHDLMGVNLSCAMCAALATPTEASDA